MLWLKRGFLACLLLVGLSLIPALKLRPEFNLVALLPDRSPAGAAYHDFVEHFGGVEKVFVVAQGTDPQMLAEAVETVEEDLEGSPHIRAVRSGIEDEDEEFFLRFIARRAPLLIPETELPTLERKLGTAGVRERIEELKRALTQPSSLLEARLARNDPLGFLDQLSHTSLAARLPVDPLTGMFVTASGDRALLVVTPSVAELDPAAGKNLAATLELAFAKHPEVQFRAVGGPLYALEDEKFLRRDLRLTLTTSFLACMVLLVIAFRSLRLPLLLFFAVAVALVWLAAALFVLVGPVSGISLGFAAVLVGLGVDYGIHAATRFREQRLAGLNVDAAMGQTWQLAGRGIAASAITTAAGFMVLLTASLRPLRDLGWVVGLGVLAMLLATAVCTGPLLVFLERKSPTKEPGRLWHITGRFVESLVGLAERRSRSVLGVALLFSLVAFYGVTRLELETDLQSLRPVDSPTMLAENAVAQDFGVGFDTTTVLVAAASVDQALIDARKVTTWLRFQLPAEAELTSPTDWVLAETEMEQRLRRLSQLQLAPAAARLKEELTRANLNVAEFRPALDALQMLGQGKDPDALAKIDWPQWLKDTIIEVDGRSLIALRLRLPQTTWPDGPPEEFLSELGKTAADVSVASAGLVGRELKDLARRDLGRLALLGVTLVGGVVLFGFRGRVKHAALSLVPVALGTLWMFGSWGLFGGSLSLLSLAVVPMMLGIGVDDGLHAMHAARLEKGQLGSAVVSVGRAMTLTTLTTAVAFLSLVSSSVSGLQQGGLQVCLGVIFCLLATLVVLPALGVVARGE